MANVARQRRLADRIRHIVADMLELRIKDPRLGFVTITDVRVTPDLREASIFYTVYGDVEEQEASAQALASATGVIRSEVESKPASSSHRRWSSFRRGPGKRPTRGRTARPSGRGGRPGPRAAVGATYAGEADPYRHPREDGDE